MNDTLKIAGRIGAELWAAKAEVERLRGLLQQVVDCQAEHYGDGCGLHLSMITLAGRIKDALSQRPKPTDTFTAVDMATAAAQGFRDGQAAVEPATAQDEPVAKTVPIPADIARAIAWGEHWDVLEAIGSLRCLLADSEGDDDIAFPDSPAQTEQQPVAWVEVKDRHEGPYEFHGIELLDSGKHNLYAAPIAQTAPQPEQSGLVGQVCGGDGTHNTVNVAVVGPVPWGDLRIGTPVRLIPAPTQGAGDASA